MSHLRLRSALRRPTRRTASTFATATVACFLTTASLAQASSIAPDAQVTLLAQQARWSGQDFESLEALEATLLPRTPRSIGLAACGPEATQALLTAAYRLRHLELHLSVIDADAPVCREATSRVLPMTPVALRGGASVAGTDDAVRAWWRQTMP